MNIIDYIPVGAQNAVSRHHLSNLTGMTDRDVREAIAKAREHYCICNMQDGKGYYIPESIEEATKYYKQEMSRYINIDRSLAGTRAFLKNGGQTNQIIESR